MKNWNMHPTDALSLDEALKESPTREAEKALNGTTIAVRHSVDTDAVYVTIIGVDVNDLRDHDVKSGKRTMMRSEPRLTSMEGFLSWSEGKFGINEGWYPVGRSLTVTGMLSWLDHPTYIENIAKWCQLLILNFNGTLVRTRSGGPFMKDAQDYYYKDDVLDFLTVLGMYGVQKVTITNQGGVAVGKLQEAEMETTLRQVAQDIGGKHYVCYNLAGAHSLPQYDIDDERRKPRPAMLIEAMNNAGVLDPNQVIVVGDHHRDEDKRFAASIHGIFGFPAKYVNDIEFFRTRAENIEEEAADATI